MIKEIIDPPVKITRESATFWVFPTCIYIFTLVIVFISIFFAVKIFGNKVKCKKSNMFKRFYIATSVFLPITAMLIGSIKLTEWYCNWIQSFSHMIVRPFYQIYLEKPLMIILPCIAVVFISLTIASFTASIIVNRIEEKAENEIAEKSEIDEKGEMESPI